MGLISLRSSVRIRPARPIPHSSRQSGRLLTGGSWFDSRWGSMIAGARSARGSTWGRSSVRSRAPGRQPGGREFKSRRSRRVMLMEDEPVRDRAPLLADARREAWFSNSPSSAVPAHLTAERGLDKPEGRRASIFTVGGSLSPTERQASYEAACVSNDYEVAKCVP